MAKSIIEALGMLQKIGVNDIVNMKIDNNMDTVHAINHRFREELIVPFVGITNNVNFIMSKGEKTIICADGVQAKLIEYKEVHICELEQTIQDLYKINAWDFVKRWYRTEKRMDSMTFIKMKLEKL